MFRVWTKFTHKSDSVKNTLNNRVYGIGPFLPLSSIFMISSWKKLFSSLLYQSIGVLIEPSDWSSFPPRACLTSWQLTASPVRVLADMLTLHARYQKICHKKLNKMVVFVFGKSKTFSIKSIKTKIALWVAVTFAYVDRFRWLLRWRIAARLGYLGKRCFCRYRLP